MERAGAARAVCALREAGSPADLRGTVLPSSVRLVMPSCRLAIGHGDLHALLEVAQRGGEWQLDLEQGRTRLPAL